MLKLRYYQQNAVCDFFQYMRSNPGKHPLIVLPTGSGKSLVQAHIVKQILDYEKTRILLLTHQKELIKQNYAEFIENFENDLFLDVGIYSAGLKKRETQNRVLFAGIQSVHNKAWELGFFDLILIDEAHRVPQKKQGTYRKFLHEMEKINPNIIIGGLSATPYRMTTGMLTDGDDAIFDDICYECSIGELIDPNHYKNKDKKQYLSKIISKNSIHKIDTSELHIRGGEFIQKEMEDAFDVPEVVKKAINEIIELSHNRKKILMFAAGIKHSESIFDYFCSIGMKDQVGIVHSKNDGNDNNIEKFKKGQIKYLINIDVLTTGFNSPDIDCIAMLRATKSPGLYYQIAGRGLRMSPDKENCLFLDYGENIMRHGPIDKIEIRKNINTGKREVSVAPMKECPKCHELCILSAKICPVCDYEFTEKDKHEQEASEKDILSKYKKPETLSIFNVKHWRHEKKGKPDSMRVDYYLDSFDVVSEWVCIEHQGFARKKAEQWLKKHIDIPPDMIKTVDDALYMSSEFKVPEKVIVDYNQRFPMVIGYVFPKEKTNEEIVSENLERLL